VSTRAQIIVEGLEEIKFYKHSDGYPEGVLPVLEPFLEGFLKRQGYWNPEYLLARMVMAFGLTDIGGVDGYGLTADWAMDIRWFYRIRQDGSIECWHTRDTWWEACTEPGFRPEEHAERVEGPWEWEKEPWAKRLEELVLEVWGE
jgi:hypothetical protein